MGATRVGLVMGSSSDWEVMRAAAEQLEHFGIDFEARVVSAHRTPDLLFEYAASARQRGLACIIAGAGGAAHLPGMAAALSELPVIGVPVSATCLSGEDALLSIVQMPRGVPVGTLAIGKPGAVNAALAATAILALQSPETDRQLKAFRGNVSKVADHFGKDGRQIYRWLKRYDLRPDEFRRE